MANSQGMTVLDALKRMSAFPAPGEVRVKVGNRLYPRSSSDDVPAIVGFAVSQIMEKPAEFDLDLAATDGPSLLVAIEHLLFLVWPDRRGSDTMHKDAARYVVDWAKQNGFDDIEMPEAVNKFAV